MFSRTLIFAFVGVFGLCVAQCPEKNGRFPKPGQCDAYVECNDGVAEDHLCPDGLLFNEKAKFFSYPCGYPKDVSCEGRAALQPAQATEDCPHQFGYFRVGDQNNCGQFTNCASGRAYTFDCPPGLAYNEESYHCDWPDQVATCDAEAFLGFRCPPNANEGFFQDEYRFHRDPNDCQKYFICINAKPRLFVCGHGYAFNEDIGGCDGIENVTSCAIPKSKDLPVPVQVGLGRGR